MSKEQRSAQMLLDDMIRHGTLLLNMAQGRTREDYERDMMFRLAVERCFMIIGEALYQMERDHPAIAAEVPECRKIIGFRHLLVHGYAKLNNDRVWEVIGSKIAPMLESLQSLCSKVSKP